MLALCWGLNWPAIKLVLAEVPPFPLRLVGLGGGGLLLFALALVQRRRLVPPRECWPGVLVGGALTVAVFNFCTAFAQLNTSTSRAAVLTYSMPMISAALAWWWLGERPHRRAQLALASGAAGIALLAWPALQAQALRQLVGPAFALAAALAWAMGTVATKRWPPVHDRVVGTAWQLVIGGAAAGLIIPLTGQAWPAHLSGTVAVAIVYHTVIATAFAYVLWYRLLDSTSATVASLTTLAVPVVGVLGAMTIVGDRPSVADWIGFVLVLGGAALVLLEGRDRGARVEPDRAS